jgi:hypothetical protein
MYQHVLIPTDGLGLTERAVRHGLLLAKFVGAKVTVITVEERLPGWLSFAGVAEATTQYAEQIKKHAANALVASPTVSPAIRFRWRTCNRMKPSSQRPRTGAATSSSWHCCIAGNDANGMDRSRSRPQRLSECVGACQEQEHRHASQVHRSRSHRHRN